MYRADIRRKRSGTPILSRKEIDMIGEELVKDFMPQVLDNPQEVDIDLFVQDYLRMDQDFQYLSHCGVYLGMTVFNDTEKIPIFDPVQQRADYISAKAHTVIIDKTLLAENQEHRYRFTMGHEAGHGYLHNEYFAYDPKQMTLFDAYPEAMIQCRVDKKKLNAVQPTEWTDKDWMEWQANALSSAILMPKSAVFKVLNNLKEKKIAKIVRTYVEIATVARIFNVSNEAAMYRLKGLGMIQIDFQYNSSVIDCISILAI